MKPTRKLAGQGIVLLGLLGAGLLVTGCRSNPPVFGNVQGVSELARQVEDKFAIGDMVTITFVGATGGDVLIPVYQEPVKEDGTITPPYVGSVVAAGQTPGELQKELQEKYEKLYKNLTVTVIPRDRYYYVTGEVRKPGPEPYLGVTDIVKAIAAAGDFTDFANKKRVRLTRASGHTQIVNVKKILNDPQFDVPIYPGDKIYVPRSFW